MAFSSKETFQKVIDSHGLQRYTPHTICTTESFLAELELVRTRGYALDNAGHEKNIRCVGIPILNDRGRVEAALGAAGTGMDLPDEESVQKTPDILREARDRISREMRYERG
jgi:DNA-binding IclR family transcriptional regulator